MGPAVGISTPSRQEQRQSWLRKPAPKMEDGQTWYLIESSWMDRFTSYLGVPQHGSFQKGIDSVSDSISGMGLDDVEPSPPGDIDNSSLLQPTGAEAFINDGEYAIFASKLQERGSRGGHEAIIKQRLVEGSDFYTLGCGQWDLISSWYGGGVEVKRRVFEAARGQKVLEIYPRLIWIRSKDAQGGDEVKIPLVVSRNTTMSELRRKAVDMCKPERPYELWLGSEAEGRHLLLCKEDDERTLEECDTADFSIFSFDQCTAGAASKAPVVIKDSRRRQGINGGFGFIGLDDEAGAKEEEEKEIEAAIAPGHGLVGLSNLGNTCFMNSALQCLSNTRDLTKFFIDGRWKADLNETNILGMKGKLAESYCKVVRELWSTGRNHAVSPSEFKRTIAKRVSQFTGYGQHDSQELLAFLMDVLHEDLNRIKTKPPTEMPTGDGSNDEKIADEAWEKHCLRNDSFIQDLFSAQYRSELVCPDEECANVSVTFDPYTSVTLPLPQAADTAVEVVFRYLDPSRRRQRIKLKLPKSDTIEQLKERLGEVLSPSVEAARIVIAEVTNSQLRNFHSDTKSVSKVQKVHGFELDAPPDPSFGSHHSPIYDPLGKDEEEERGKRLHARIFMRKSGVGMPDFLGTPFVVSLPVVATCDQVKGEIVSKMSRFIRGYEGLEKGEAGGEGGEKGGIMAALVVKKVDNYYSQDGIEVSGEGPAPRLSARGTLFSVEWSEEGLKTYYDDEEEAAEDVPAGGAEGDSDEDEGGLTLVKCLEAFIQPETLEEENTWYCGKCKDHKCARKTMSLWTAPPNLVLHFKRFSQTGHLGREKLETPVQYPLEGLDISPYVRSPQSTKSGAAGSSGLIYDLYGVINHFGGSNFGHYTAYALSPSDDQWHLYDDSHVSSAKKEDVCSPAAYVLFYRRRDAPPMS